MTSARIAATEENYLRLQRGMLSLELGPKTLYTWTAYSFACREIHRIQSLWGIPNNYQFTCLTFQQFFKMKSRR